MLLKKVKNNIWEFLEFSFSLFCTLLERVRVSFFKFKMSFLDVPFGLIMQLFNNFILLKSNIKLLLFVVCLSFNIYKLEAQSYFILNENITYNVNFGILKVGEVILKSDSVYANINNKKSIKITILGYTVGAVGLFSHIDNKYVTHIDSATYLPLKAERKQLENNFKLFEINDFDHANNTVSTTRLNYNENTYNIKLSTITGTMHDMISAYYNLRNTKIEKLKKNDTISVEVFFEEKPYIVKFQYLERDKIRTKIGKFKSYLFSPILPPNTILSKKENPVKVWISDDNRHILLNISMQTKYGKFEIDIKDYVLK